MTSDLPARKVLVLSPSASHPQDYGNRNRVFETTSKFKQMGYEVHFILYPFESDWVNDVPESAADMRKEWASFTVIPPSMPLHMPAADTHHLIDEWWDSQIGHYLEWLFAREYFDVFVVNYTFFSRAFEFAPRSTVKVLETHDLFSGRKELFEAFGAGPEFFYTTPEQESIAFDRADIVVAIKDGEAEIIRGMTARSVVSLPYFVHDRSVALREDRTSASTELRVGFIGALNTVNSLNMQKFLERFAKYRTIYVPNITIAVAGNVGTRLKAGPGVELLGHVSVVKEFYENIDVIIAPMDFSTGIKIKVGEALSYGKPVVATRNGFDGFPPIDQFHSLEDIDAVCRALIKLSFDRERLLLLEERTRTAAQLAKRRAETAYAALARSVREKARRIVFVTDQPLWKSETVQQERLAQWCEFCSYMARVAVVYVGEGPAGTFNRGPQLSKFSSIYDHHGRPDEAMETIGSLAELYEIAEIVISTKGELAQFFWDRLCDSSRHISLDTWVPALAEIAQDISQSPPKDVWLSGARDRDGESKSGSLAASALRYLPGALHASSMRSAVLEILAVECGPDWLDGIGIELLQSTPLLTDVLSVIRYSSPSGNIEESDLFQRLKERRVPGTVLAVGRDTRAAEVVRCIAEYWDVNFIRVTSSDFPRMLGEDGGEAVLCRSYSDLAGYLARSAIATPNMSINARDVGWSRYWRSILQTA